MAPLHRASPWDDVIVYNGLDHDFPRDVINRQPDGLVLTGLVLTGLMLTGLLVTVLVLAGLVLTGLLVF